MACPASRRRLTPARPLPSTFDLPADPATWTVTVNGEIAIDSTQLDPNLIDKNLIGSVG